MRLATARVAGIEKELIFAIHESNDRHVSERIASEGCWEPFETEVMCRILTSPIGGNPIFVDCGANIGWFSVIAAALGASVIAIEPMPANARLLHVNVGENGLNDFVEVHEVALGSTEGAGQLRLSLDNQGDHRFVPSNVAVTRTEREEISVQMTTLDAILHGRIPALLKLDTQGSEVSILRGAHDALSDRSAVIVLEFWPYGLQQCGSSGTELCDILEQFVDMTHACFEIVEWQKRLVPLSMATLVKMATVGGYSAEMKGFTNIILIPIDRVTRVADLIEK
jgi:FkbM family methyltransferase